MVRILASNPDYSAIALSLHLLGIAINPACWFGHDDTDGLYRSVVQLEVLEELDELLIDHTFRRLTDG